MDFSRRTNPKYAPDSQSAISTNKNANTATKDKHRDPRWLRLTSVLELFAATLLIVSVIALLIYNGRDKSEQRYIDSSKYQAVFLNRGEVYFGKIAEVTPAYLRIVDVYSINQEQTSGNTQQQTNPSSTKNYDLTKIVKGVHCPTDAMVIYKDQVSYWENLQPEGQVVKIIDEFKKQNPGNIACSDAQATQKDSTNNTAKPDSNQQTTPANNQTTTNSTDTNR